MRVSTIDVKYPLYVINQKSKEETIMSKMVNEVLSTVKGENKVNDILTGKGSFSQQGFADTVSAFANDTTFKVKTFGKDGKQTGEVNISELLRQDFKKTLEKAKYPQKSEAGVIDAAEMVTSGLAKAIPYLVMEQIKCGKKFDLPTQSNVGGSIYLNPVAAKVKTTQVRDPKTQQNLGSVTVTSQDSIQIRAKSPVPNHLQIKVRKDPSGKVINN